MEIDQRTRSAMRRQHILDFLHAHPGAKMAAIGDSLFGEGKSRSRHHNTIRQMIEWSEVRFEGAPRARQYWAIIKTTRSAEDVSYSVQKNIIKGNLDRHAENVRHQMKLGGALYVHTPSEKPIPNQGGQGCLRRTVSVNCQQNY